MMIFGSGVVSAKVGAPRVLEEMLYICAMILNNSHPTIAWMRRYLRPGFMITTAIIAFVLFFNDNSLLTTYEHEQEINRLRTEIKENRDTLRYYEALNRALDTDIETMERIVRERYHMQRPTEDVYVFE